MLEVDEWEEAQVAAREQVARAKFDSCLGACRLVSCTAVRITPSLACDVGAGVHMGLGMGTPADGLPERLLPDPQL